ncbi:MAG: error-prone DNA polymerase [Betaproteobacteria bacterium]
MSTLPEYAELHCLSNFTFLRGASHPEELVARAHALRYAALALTDECSLSGVVRADEAARELGLKLIIGSEIRLDDGLKFVLLATDRESYGRLSAFITRGRITTAKGRYRLRRSDLATHDLEGCLAILVPPASENQTMEQAAFIAGRFPQRAWIAVELLRGRDDDMRLSMLREISVRTGLPRVAAGDVHMHAPERRMLQDALTAVRLGLPLHEAADALYPNAERHLRSREELAKIYPQELLSETVRIAERCNFSLRSLRYEYPDEIVPDGHTPTTYLRELTERGLQRRFPAGLKTRVREQVEKELALIAFLRYEPFFLTVYDIVQYAEREGILHQGRGSAANSIVCYALGITAVGPDRLEMLSERFISRERAEPPDIDVDFEHQRREQVIQYIYEKYGRDRAAIAATLITYQPRSAVRDIGKALGLELAQVDRLAGSLAWWDRPDVLRKRLAECGFDPDNGKIRLLVELVTTLIGFPRHLSQHVGGFVISRGPLSHLVPIENAAMPERSVIQWDKDDLESLGLIKVDVLALGMLSVIRRAFEAIRAYRGSAPSMDEIANLADDDAIYRMVQRADTIGVFQIESRAQMSMLPRLKPANFYDLAIEIAIVRPGPIQGDMVHPYLKRRQMNPEDIVYENEQIRGVLGRTLGVPIFQEQVMQLAMVAANFTADDADKLRRAMAAWRRQGSLEKFEAKLRLGMAENGYKPEFADAVCRQIQGFGEYGFPESHSASFALLAYVSSWLKYYEPAVFLAAMLNSQPMGFYSPSALVQDARRHGVEIRPADVNWSEWECTLEPPGVQPQGCGSPVPGHRPRLPLATVRLGLLMIKGLSQAGAKRLTAARAQQPFEDVADLARRAELSNRDLNHLAAAGALASLSGHRHNAHWHAAGLERLPQLLEDAPGAEKLPQLKPPTEGKNIVADYQSMGLTLGRHPLALLRSRLRRMHLSTAAELQALPDGASARGAGIVTCRQRPGTSRGVVFVTLEDETGYLNVVVWNNLVERQRRELLGSKLLGVEGVMQKEGGVVHLVAHRLTDHTPLLGRLALASRDFH